MKILLKMKTMIMKTNFSNLFSTGIAVLVIVALMLPGCAPIVSPVGIVSTPYNNSLQITTSPTTHTIPTSQIAATPVPPLKMVLAVVPANCYLDFSPDFEWMTKYCGPGGILKVGKFGETQMATLFEGGLHKAFFSPDSKKLVVLAHENISSQDAVWLYDVENWQAPKKLLSFASTGVATWSPDSKAIAIDYLVKGYALSILYIDGTIKNLLTYNDVRSPDVGYFRGGFGPTWSPDSQKIAYVNDSIYDTQPVQIHTVDVITGKKELLYAGKPGEAGFKPLWSPDGNMIALGDFLKESHPIYIYNIKEKTFTAFGDFYLDYTAAWSPDSKYLAVCNAPKESYVISVANNQIVNLNENHCSSVQGWKGNDNIIVHLQGPEIYSIHFSK
jgi:Tol biopolymer transport system component